MTPGPPGAGRGIFAAAQSATKTPAFTTLRTVYQAPPHRGAVTISSQHQTYHRTIRAYPSTIHDTIWGFPCGRIR